MKKVFSENETSNSSIGLKISFWINLVVVIMELCTVKGTFSEHGIGMFKLYTIDSNLVALISSVWYILLLNKRKPLQLTFMRMVAVVNLTLTFFIVLFVLAPSMGGIKHLMFEGNGLFHHFFCPILTVVSFLFFEKDLEQRKGLWRYVPAPTAVYAAILITLNILRVLTGPYPFLHVYEQPVWVSVAWVMAILSIVAIFSWVYEKLKKILG